MDYQAYQQQSGIAPPNTQRHKQCAFNLYIAAMLGNALAPLCTLFGLKEWEGEAHAMAERLLDGVVRKFWDDREGVFVANLPWFAEEQRIRYCDRSLALGVLFDLCPGGRTSRACNDTQAGNGGVSRAGRVAAQL